ncbi:hypothetical protein [Roseovarius sp.]|uniref:hypothetical protein n=1 Tax=Roseovarius sp. TaxID=1486281 RepID=UPI003A974675
MLRRRRHAIPIAARASSGHFLLIYKGDVDKSLTAYVAWADGKIRELNGVPLVPGDPNVPLIADTADITTPPLR